MSGLAPTGLSLLDGSGLDLTAKRGRGRRRRDAGSVIAVIGDGGSVAFRLWVEAGGRGGIQGFSLQVFCFPGGSVAA